MWTCGSTRHSASTWFFLTQQSLPYLMIKLLLKMVYTSSCRRGFQRAASWALEGREGSPLWHRGRWVYFWEQSHHMGRKLVDNANVCLERAGCWVSERILYKPEAATRFWLWCHTNLSLSKQTGEIQILWRRVWTTRLHVYGNVKFCIKNSEILWATKHISAT